MGRLMVGVSGVRGEYPDTLTLEIAERFGRAFATLLASRARGGAAVKIILGRDTRQSGAALAEAIAEGVQAGGVDVVDLGQVSTPGAALMIETVGADGGIVVTASHNPLPYNGIKFMSPAGTNLPPDGVTALRAIYDSGQFAAPARRGTRTANGDTDATHVAAVVRIVDVAAIAARRFAVVLDSINGAGGTSGVMLLKQLGCEVVHVNGEPTGEFAHAPEPIAENLGQLCEAVRVHDAHIGFAQDPDADRLVIADEAGRFIGEEYTLALTAAFLLSDPARRGDLATNLSTTRMIDDVAARAGVRVHRTPVGEVNVAAKMVQAGCVFGGEGNGGVMHPEVVVVRDSLAAMAMMLNYLADSGRRVSDLVADLPRYVMVKDKFPCPPAAAGEILAEAEAAFAGRAGAAIDTQDGLRVDLPSGWVHVRASNTEPIMRITAEAAEADAADAIARQVRQIADNILSRQG